MDEERGTSIEPNLDGGGQERSSCESKVRQHRLPMDRRHSLANDVEDILMAIMSSDHDAL